MISVGSSEQTRGPSASKGPGRGGWTVLALALFAVGTGLRFAPILAAGPDRYVPSDAHLERETLDTWRYLTEGDSTYGTWLVSRNARALLEHPLDFFESLHCTPLPQAVTLGIPAVAMGVLAIPFTLFFDNPVLVYNAVLISMSILACLAMYLLVREWTGIPLAAIVAGLLYGFSPLRLAAITHPSQRDDIWTVFAIYFAYRLLVHARWRDALGLAASFAMQATESFYPFLAAVIGIPPILIWMLISQRLEKIRPLQVVLVAAIAVAVIVWMYPPYLDTRSGGMWSDRTGIQQFAPLAGYLPGGMSFPGFAVLVGVAAALLLGRRGLAHDFRGDPRLALLLSALLVAWFAAGPLPSMRYGTSIPDLYGTMAAFFPGLDSIRAVLRLDVGVYLALVILAGIGAAALVRCAGTRGAWAGCLLALLTVVDLARPASLGLEPRYEWVPLAIEAEPETLEFFGELGERGNRGPVLELPFDYGNESFRLAPQRVLATHYHGRKTSACFGSFFPPIRHRLGLAAKHLPETQAVEELHALGFTTVIAHHPEAQRGFWRKRFLRESDGPGPHLAYLHGSARHSAFQVVVPQPDPPPHSPE